MIDVSKDADGASRSDDLTGSPTLHSGVQGLIVIHLESANASGGQELTGFQPRHLEGIKPTSLIFCCILVCPSAWPPKALSPDWGRGFKALSKRQTVLSSKKIPGSFRAMFSRAPSLFLKNREKIFGKISRWPLIFSP